jgi:hypothetical protein
MKIFYQTFSITTKLISILLLIILAQSCSKDANCGNQSDIVNSYYISADDKSKIPFKGNDTLIYYSNEGDTDILIGNGKRAYMDVISKNIGDLECSRYQVDYNETISIEYTGNNIELNKIKFKIYGNTESTKIQFLINSYYGNTYPYYLNNTTTYTDSVRIGNKFYTGRPIVWLGINTLLYNFNNGFLKIQFNGGKVWILKI